MVVVEDGDIEWVIDWFGDDNDKLITEDHNIQNFHNWVFLDNGGESSTIKWESIEIFYTQQLYILPNGMRYFLASTILLWLTFKFSCRMNIWIGKGSLLWRICTWRYWFQRGGKGNADNQTAHATHVLLFKPFPLLYLLLAPFSVYSYIPTIGLAIRSLYLPIFLHQKFGTVRLMSVLSTNMGMINGGFYILEESTFLLSLVWGYFEFHF